MCAARNGECAVFMMKYIKEFLLLLTGLTVLFAAAVIALILFFAPWGLGIYLRDVLGYSMPIVFGVIISCFMFYYCVARHFDLIDEV